MQDTAIIDVSEATFERDVVEASYDHPVVVDFWAPWCGPCRQLGPVLERLADEADGAWTLARLNVDENPALSRRFGVQGIPAVKGFRDGRVSTEFVGAQPEAAVRRFLDRLMPTPADLAASEGRQRAAEGDLFSAERAFRAALAERSDHPRALLGLGQLLAESGRPEEAITLLGSLLPNTAEAREAVPILARLKLAQSHAAGDTMTQDKAAQRLKDDPRDPAANLALGQALAAHGDYAAALPYLLASVQRDKTFQGGAARQAMLAIFDALGPDHPLALDFRRKLASALY